MAQNHNIDKERLTKLEIENKALNEHLAKLSIEVVQLRSMITKGVDDWTPHKVDPKDIVPGAKIGFLGNDFVYMK